MINKYFNEVFVNNYLSAIEKIINERVNYLSYMFIQN